jgi:hypothetical protein
MTKSDVEHWNINEKDYVIICDNCGFWFGRGTRGGKDFHVDHYGTIGIVGKPTIYPLDSLTIPTTDLIKAINTHPDYLTKINPYKAEDLFCYVLNDAIDCEVKKIGGRQDKGIDAFIISNDEIKTIVQVKWRTNTKKAESVKVVREFAGTLLARGIPSGLLVTTSERFSAYAINEIENVRLSKLSRNEITIDHMTYSDIMKLLSISTRKITQKPSILFTRVSFERSNYLIGQNGYTGMMGYCRDCDIDLLCPDLLTTVKTPKVNSIEGLIKFYQMEFNYSYQQTYDLAIHTSVPPNNCHNCGEYLGPLYAEGYNAFKECGSCLNLNIQWKWQ